MGWLADEDFWVGGWRFLVCPYHSAIVRSRPNLAIKPGNPTWESCSRPMNHMAIMVQWSQNLPQVVTCGANLWSRECCFHRLGRTPGYCIFKIQAFATWAKDVASSLQFTPTGPCSNAHDGSWPFNLSAGEPWQAVENSWTQKLLWEIARCWVK